MDLRDPAKILEKNEAKAMEINVASLIWKLEHMAVKPSRLKQVV